MSQMSRRDFGQVAVAGGLTLLGPAAPLMRKPLGDRSTI